MVFHVCPIHRVRSRVTKPCQRSHGAARRPGCLHRSNQIERIAAFEDRQLRVEGRFRRRR